MKKSILQSKTTQTVAGAGATGSALLSVLVLLQQLFPDADWLTHPALVTGSTWIINMFFIPWASRMIAKTRGK
jgi:hypothetical protein